jgi:hypothetical protein
MRFNNKTPGRRFFIRPNILILIAAAAAVILLFSCGRGDQSAVDGDRAELNRWLDSERTSPGDLVYDVLKSGRSVVLFQDNPLRGDTVKLMHALVPTIRSAGITDLGVYFLDSSRQEEIDAFVAGNNIDVTATELLFQSDAALGYREYSDFLGYVREFNSLAKPGETPLRLVALGKQGELSADIIKELLNPGKTGDGKNGPRSVFLWITMNDVENGVLPSDKSGAPRPLIAVHHGPDKKNLRWDGFIENVAVKRDVRDRSFGFLGEKAPFAMWKGDESGVSADIYLVTPYRYSGVTPIPDFISAKSAEAALEFFPEISMKKPRFVAAIRMNGMIRRDARRYQRALNRLNVPE